MRALERKTVVGMRCIPLLALVSILFLAYTPPARGDETGTILDSAESLFKSMKAKDYPAIWSGLTRKSHEDISGEVYKRIKHAGETGCSLDIIEKDFEAGGPLARSYWDAFVDNLNPDMVLNESAWDIGFIKKDKAEICLLYRKSENPARLKMFREDGKWRVGLTETFGRKR